jgi:hypothetical protein
MYSSMVVSMPNGIENQLNLMHNASLGVKTMTQDSGLTTDSVAADGARLDEMEQMRLMDEEFKEMMASDPSSTVGQPGGLVNQKIIQLPPKEFFAYRESCSCPKFSDSPWTRYPAPIPKLEQDVSLLSLPSRLAKAAPIKDLKFPPAVPNFPIQFDRTLGYRDFLS